jgi:hypothetical protein
MEKVISKVSLVLVVSFFITGQVLAKSDFELSLIHIDAADDTT